MISPTTCSQHGDVSMAKTPNPQNVPEARASVCDDALDGRLCHQCVCVCK